MLLGTKPFATEKFRELDGLGGEDADVAAGLPTLSQSMFGMHYQT